MWSSLVYVHLFLLFGFHWVVEVHKQDCDGPVLNTVINRVSLCDFTVELKRNCRTWKIVGIRLIFLNRIMQ